MKKNLFALVFGCAILSFGGCNSMESKVNELTKGKDGVYAAMETTRGTIFLELFYKDTPLTVTNFVGLAEGTLDAAKGKKFYDGLNFHRVIADFMIQGGDPLGNGTGGPGYKFPDEIVEKYKFTEPGLLAMANAGPGTNGSQFFITHVPTEWLNGNHTIFGKVLNKDSQDVVNKVQQGDKINKLTIVRQGAGKNFSATQKDFNERLTAATKAAEDKKRAALADKIAEVEKTFPGYNKDPNGIYYKTTREGSGVKCGGGRNVAVEYKGYLVDGTVFDQSKGRGPLEFTTAGGQMIPGFDIMVQDMKINEKRTIVLPPDLGYGSRGIPQAGIPGNSFLCFDIELTRIR